MGEEKDINELLDAIIWGRRIIEVENCKSEEVVFVLRPLTLEERNMGNYIYGQAMKKGKGAGVLTRDQLIRQAIKHDLWKSTNDKDLKILHEELSKITDALHVEETTNMLDKQGRPKRKSPTSKFKRFTNQVTSIQKTIRQLESDHVQYIDLPSIEYQAECNRGNYFLYCATLGFPEMQQVWSSLQDLENETDTILVGALLRKYYDDSIADDSEIRRIARSGFWRCKWMGSKKNSGVKTLFNREMYDLTLDQFRLVYWSQVYDSAYESLESPSDEVINDDKLFDRWLEEQEQKQKQQRKKSAFDKKVSHLTKDGNEVGFNVQGEFCQNCTCGVKDEAEARGSDKRGHAHDPSCSYGVYLYYSEERKQQKVEEIQSTNPASVRKFLGSEQKYLSRIGSEGMEEQNLRGNKARQTLGMETKWHGAGEYGKGK